jgi:hypothetical protein
VAALEKKQRHFKNPGLANLEFELLSTLRHGAPLSDLFLVSSTFVSVSNHNPSPTFGTSDAGARGAISHFSITLPPNMLLTLTALEALPLSDHPEPANEYHLKPANESSVRDIESRGGL